MADFDFDDFDDIDLSGIYDWRNPGKAAKNAAVTAKVATKAAKRMGFGKTALLIGGVALAAKAIDDATGGKEERARRRQIKEEEELKQWREWKECKAREEAAKTPEQRAQEKKKEKRFWIIWGCGMLSLVLIGIILSCVL